MTHICVSKQTIRQWLAAWPHQAIIWTNAGILLIGPLRTNFTEIIEIKALLFKKVYFKMSFGNWRPFCLGLNVSRYEDYHAVHNVTNVISDYCSIFHNKPLIIDYFHCFGNEIFNLYWTVLLRWNIATVFILNALGKTSETFDQIVLFPFTLGIYHALFKFTT